MKSFEFNIGLEKQETKPEIDSLDELDLLLKIPTQPSSQPAHKPEEISLDELDELDFILSQESDSLDSLDEDNTFDELPKQSLLADYSYWRNTKIEEMKTRVGILDEKIKKIEHGTKDSLIDSLTKIDNLESNIFTNLRQSRPDKVLYKYLAIENPDGTVTPTKLYNTLRSALNTEVSRGFGEKFINSEQLKRFVENEMKRIAVTMLEPNGINTQTSGYRMFLDIMIEGTVMQFKKAQRLHSFSNSKVSTHIENFTQEKKNLEDKIDFYTTCEPDETELVSIKGCLLSDGKYYIQCDCEEIYAGKLVEFEISRDTKRRPPMAMSLVENKCPYCNRLSIPEVDTIKLFEEQRDEYLKNIKDSATFGSSSLKIFRYRDLNKLNPSFFEIEETRRINLLEEYDMEMELANYMCEINGVYNDTKDYVLAQLDLPIKNYDELEILDKVFKNKELCEKLTTSQYSFLEKSVYEGYMRNLIDAKGILGTIPNSLSSSKDTEAMLMKYRSKLSEDEFTEFLETITLIRELYKENILLNEQVYRQFPYNVEYSRGTLVNGDLPLGKHKLLIAKVELLKLFIKNPMILYRIMKVQVRGQFDSNISKIETIQSKKTYNKDINHYKDSVATAKISSDLNSPDKDIRESTMRKLKALEGGIDESRVLEIKLLDFRCKRLLKIAHYLSKDYGVDSIAIREIQVEEINWYVNNVIGLDYTINSLDDLNSNNPLVKKLNEIVKNTKTELNNYINSFNGEIKDLINYTYIPPYDNIYLDNYGDSIVEKVESLGDFILTELRQRHNKTDEGDLSSEGYIIDDDSSLKFIRLENPYSNFLYNPVKNYDVVLEELT